MISEISFKRSVDRVNAYVQQNVRLAGTEKKEEVLEIFSQTQRLFPHWVIMTCPVMHPALPYISDNATGVFGLSNKNVQLNVNAEKFFSYVHDADQHDLYDCFNFVHNYLEALPPEDHHAFRFVYHYRFKKSTDEYIYLHDEKSALFINGSGNLYYSLFRDITAEQTFGGVKVELFRQEISSSKIAEYRPLAGRNHLTKRESELVMLIRQGLTTKEIARLLKISHNTVRNIKSKMFEKFNVSNTVELLNKTA